MVLGHALIQRGMTGHAAGRVLLEQLYRAQMGRDMPQIRIQPGGKPYFADGSAHFSLTHTPHHVFCALSSCPVGIDAEEADRPINLALADKILSFREKAHYEKAQDKRLTLLKFWVLKEAQAKLRGTGLRGYPNDTDFTPDDPRITLKNGCLLAVIQEENHAV